jgi:hypothetical protein
MACIRYRLYDTHSSDRQKKKEDAMIGITENEPQMSAQQELSSVSSSCYKEGVRQEFMIDSKRRGSRGPGGQSQPKKSSTRKATSIEDASIR